MDDFDKSRHPCPILYSDCPGSLRDIIDPLK